LQGVGDPGPETESGATPILSDPTEYQPHSVSSALAVVLTTQSALDKMHNSLATQQGSDPLTNYLTTLSIYQLFDIMSAIKVKKKSSDFFFTREKKTRAYIGH
jgi:hypothetical protein